MLFLRNFLLKLLPNPTHGKEVERPKVPSHRKILKTRFSEESISLLSHRLLTQRPGGTFWTGQICFPGRWNKKKRGTVCAGHVHLHVADLPERPVHRGLVGGRHAPQLLGDAVVDPAHGGADRVAPLRLLGVRQLGRGALLDFKVRRDHHRTYVLERI